MLAILYSVKSMYNLFQKNKTNNISTFETKQVKPKIKVF